MSCKTLLNDDIHLIIIVEEACITTDIDTKNQINTLYIKAEVPPNFDSHRSGQIIVG